MTDAHAIPILKDMRKFCRVVAALGFNIPLTGSRADTVSLIRALLARRPPITWDGEVLEGALVLEVGERAAHALRLARRRVARRQARGCSVVAGSVTSGRGRRRP